MEKQMEKMEKKYLLYIILPQLKRGVTALVKSHHWPKHPRKIEPWAQHTRFWDRKQHLQVYPKIYGQRYQTFKLSREELFPISNTE
jgi:hypothetical protein